MKAQLGNLQPVGFPGLPEGWSTEWKMIPSADHVLQLFLAIHHSAAKDTNKPHRALLIVPGLGEHGGRYLHAPHYLKDTVDSVYCLDQRGHGRSEGIRGHCDRFTQFTDDLAAVISKVHEEIHAKHEKAELHVLGHSFGGLVTLRTLFLNPTLPIRSVTVSSPLLGIKVKVPLIKKLAGRALSNIWGSLQMSNELKPELLSHDPQVAIAYTKDRLVHDKVTPRMFTEMLAAIDDTAKRDAGLPYALQILVSLSDQIVDAEASQKFFQALKIRDKQLKTYPGFFHEPFTEIGKEKAFEDVASWIKSHP
jgi:alpha-beta hydrolase superfamily lysophospholipase